MFTILPADDAKTAELSKREGQTRPLSAMVLTVDEAMVGHVLYRVERDRLELLCLRAPDDAYAEWLVRAALNAGVNRMAITATCSDPTLFPLLTGLGFRAVGTAYEVFIPDFFNRPCCGGEK